MAKETKENKILALKAQAYDLILQQQLIQQRLQAIGQELDKLQKTS